MEIRPDYRGKCEEAAKEWKSATESYVQAELQTGVDFQLTAKEDTAQVPTPRLKGICYDSLSRGAEVGILQPGFA
jgi:hypothetical protein